MKKLTTFLACLFLMLQAVALPPDNIFITGVIINAAPEVAGSLIFTSGDGDYDLHVSDLTSLLSSTHVEVRTFTGDITVVIPISWSAVNALTLTSGNDIFINDVINPPSSGGLYLIADRNIILSAPINSGTNCILQAGGYITNTSTITTNIGGTITIKGALSNNGTILNNGTIIPADGSSIILSGGTLTGNKINGANANTPTESSRTSTSVTLNAATLRAITGQDVQYAVSTTTTPPAADIDWQDGLTFSGLTPNTTYYFFARSKSNTNFYAGAASSPIIIATVPYIDVDGTTKYPPSGTPVTPLASVADFSALSYTLSDGWYILTENVTLASALTIAGDVKLIIADGKTLTFNLGAGNDFNINVGASNLSVYAQSGGSSQGKLASATTPVTKMIDLQGGSLTNTAVIMMSGNNQVCVRNSLNSSSVTNGLNGLIQGGVNGICLDAGGTVVNSGTIRNTSADHDGIIVQYAAASVTNSGTIEGTRYCVYFYFAPNSSIVNSGTISGKTNGIRVYSGKADVTNLYGGLVEGSSSGIWISAAAAAGSPITNSGTITGTAATGYGINADVTVGITNTSSGLIQGGTCGIRLGTAAAGSPITNSGAITGTEASSAGINALSSVQITNNTGGEIVGVTDGIKLDAGGTVTNSGAIRKTGGSSGSDGAIFAAKAVTINNNTGGLIEGHRGIYIGISADGSIINNSGTITCLSGPSGILAQSMTTINNEEGGSISNSGTYNYSIYGVFLNVSGSVLTNNGSIEITATASGAYPVYGIYIDNNSASTTLTNNGIISVTTTDSGTPYGVYNYMGITTLTNNGAITGNVSLFNAANTVTLVAGSSITGYLDIGVNISSTLILTGAASTTQSYTDAVTDATTLYGALQKEGAGAWILDKDFTPNGGTTVNEGTLYIAAANMFNVPPARTLTNNALIIVNGVLTNSGTVTNTTGLIILETGSTLSGTTPLYKLNLNANGGSPNLTVAEPTLSFDFDKLATYSKNPTFTDYTLLGWSKTAPSGSLLLTSPYAFTDDELLYAQWLSDFPPIVSCPTKIYGYQGYDYNVTEIAGLCWTENMRNTKYDSGDDIPFARAYQDDAANADIYGLLYDWESATGVAVGQPIGLPQQGICPTGWHIPTRAELADLDGFTAEELMSSLHWIAPVVGTDVSGFTAVPAGKYDNTTGTFNNLFGFAGFWSSETETTEKSYCSCLHYYCNIIKEFSMNKTDGLSVRCVMDDGGGSVPTPVEGKVNGAGGTTLTFMTYNLGATPMTAAQQMIVVPPNTSYGDYYQWGRQADGHEVSTSGTYPFASGVTVDGNGQPTGAAAGLFITTFAYPFDWHPTGDNTLWDNPANNPCPAGWRLPTNAEWHSVMDNNTWTWQGAPNAGYKISPDGGTTTTLFLPAAGCRGIGSGGIGAWGSNGHYWSSTPYSTVYVYSMIFISGFAAETTYSKYERSFGFSVRCIAE